MSETGVPISRANGNCLPMKGIDMQRREFLMGGAGACAVAGAATHADAKMDAAQDISKRRSARSIHEGTLIVNGLDVSPLNDNYVELLKQGGVSCMHKSAFGIDTFSDLYNFVDSRADVVVARSVTDVREAYANEQISLIFGTQMADPLATRMLNVIAGPPRTSLRGHYELGLRILGLAYNLPNHFGGGGMETTVPLSRAGHLLVEEVHKLKMLLDVGGHTGEQTSLDAISIAPEMPVICSHTNISAIADNPRNISDRLIDAIALTGGVIGITAVNDFHVRTRDHMDVAHSPRVGVKVMVDQIAYLKKRVGVDHIGLGPDFTEGLRINHDLVNMSLAINREIISDGEWLYVKGFEKISQLPNVTKEMISRGWSTEDIQKILGGNWLRVYEAAWGG